MAKPVTNKMILGAGLICLIGVLIIAFVPIIPEPKQCFTTPCDQFITIFDAVQKLDVSTETLTPLAPDDMPEETLCIEIYQPVCGTDGITYSNICFLEITEEVELDHQGVC